MSKSVNKHLLLGNLTKDPEVRYTNGGKAVATLSLATNERYKKDGEWLDKPSYHTVIVWTPMAEVAAQFLKKGGKVFIEGRVETRSYDKDGVKKYVTETIAQELVLVDSKPSASEPAAQPDASDDIPF